MLGSVGVSVLAARGIVSFTHAVAALNGALAGGLVNPISSYNPPVTQTIAAISSSLAPAARIIVRVSGPRSHPIAIGLTDLRTLSPASAGPAMLSFNGLTCPVCLYVFAGPRSYTGQDTVEFHIPGSPVLAKMLLDELYRQGAKPAEPGEFTARAFFNGRIGLTEAEGVAATIAASSEIELHAARQLAAGELTRRLTPITDTIAQTLALIEVGIDFSEEEVTFLASDEVLQRIDDAERALNDLLEQSGRFEQLAHEPRIVFVGRPNAGKSALMNALTGEARSVVSPVAGTTRDILTAPLDLKSGRILLCDVAGLERVAETEIDRQMQQHAGLAMESATHVVLIHDCTDKRPLPELSRTAELIVISKIDLQEQAPTVHPGLRGVDTVRVSSVTGDGLASLRDALDRLAFSTDNTAATVTLNRRHLSAISDAQQALSRAAARVAENAPELVAMDLREVLDALGSITGQVTPDDILGRVFSAFCIGK